MEYIVDPGQVERGNTQGIPVNSLTENSNNPPRQEKQVDDKQSGELKPYSFYVNYEIDISTHKGEKLKVPVNIQTVPTVVEDITKVPHTTPSVIKNTPSSSKAPQTPNPASSQVITSTTSKTSRGGDQFCLKNPPLKIKKRIEMKKASTLRVGAGYWYGLEDGQDLVIKSSVGNYKKHSDRKEDQEPVMKDEHVEAAEEKFPLPIPQGEYIEEFEEKPSDLKLPPEGEYVEEDDDEKPITSTKENEAVGTNDIYKNELYKEIENLSVNDKPADQDSTG